MLIDISRPLDEHTAVFPGDVPFSRSLTMSLERGDPCNVSAFTSSAHAGTHVDLPCHFSDDLLVAPLDVFIGPAVVIEVSDWAELSAKRTKPGMRVLFKTQNSLTDYRTFDENFLCVSGDAVGWLIRNHAVLVGVDAPSVDPVESKTLENHHALRSAGIAILENLDLSLAAEGEYELIALPLSIQQADATWVRAVLRTL